MANTNGVSTPSFKPDNSSKSISASQVFGINRLVKLLIVIDGKIISHYKHFNLSQNTGKHHRFELILAYDSLGSRENQNLESSNDFLGKRITVVQKYKDISHSPERTFVGVITEVSYLQEQSGLGNIVISGYSPTILLDGAPHIQSFGGEQPVNMSIIANQLIKEGIDTAKYDVRVDANDYSEIIYSSQYNETHYNYLARMAEAYGEQFYYDGEVLHFGKLPSQNQPVKLIYGSNVNDIKIQIKAVHTKPSFYGYNSSQNAKLTSGLTPATHKSDLANIAYKKNDGESSIFKTPSLQIAPIRANTDKDVVYSQTSASGSKAVEVLHVSGTTTIPFLYPGCVADLEMRKEESNQTTHFTRVMITETTHAVDTVGHYIGTFKAIANDTGFLAQPEFVNPVAQPQLATVISNTDPLGQGRVSVRFDWQMHDATDFIRMMTPDAGGTDEVTQNRGYVAIPEVGDQVMVGFEHNHPDKPFVMGGMFHGGTALGGFTDNRVKSIQTRSGHKIIFTEDESIIITDKSGNEIHLDTTGSNINITAPETMTLNCKNMNINVAENMNTVVGMDASESIGMNISQTIGLNSTQSIGAMKMTSVVGDASLFITGKLTEMIDGDVHSETKMERNEVSEGKITSQSTGTHEHHSDKIVQNNSAEKSNNF
ncbi:type VI secretion system Vgr family protein [Halpernia frigidisoli]|uniref:Phage late control gene D protein (GPD) n=1 Tax=Halpernia frigidisoli TaxID=1125876 RepID=A0A1I3INI5_9FLAO|nr:phage baseplate assembly protein V [Halpernia frigidisoli]SFI49482.1 Phage late control gene D protein (GPD) [Halpernia frigidisoli]